MKAVLMSIQPKWVELIASGKRTVEVRKTAPKIETPFKVYVYETRGTSETPIVYEDGYMDFHGRGKVVAEFVCDRIDEIKEWNGYRGFWDILPSTCLSGMEIMLYATVGKPLYFWNISDLKVYDKPKELSEFHKPLRCGNFKCTECGYFEYYAGIRRRCNLDWSLKRPPQSWCYVEEL